MRFFRPERHKNEGKGIFFEGGWKFFLRSKKKFYNDKYLIISRIKRGMEFFAKKTSFFANFFSNYLHSNFFRIIFASQKGTKPVL